MGLLEQQAQPAPQERVQDPSQVSEQARPFLRRAVEILYRDNFENLVRMIKDAGQGGFGQAISTAINTTLERLKKEMQIPPELTAEVGAALFAMILEDMVLGGTIGQLDENALIDALQRTLRDYAEANPGELNLNELAAQAQQQGDVFRGM